MSVVTPLHKTLKRELRVNDKAFVLTISPDSLKLTVKGRRKGYELKWADVISGDAALATALNASLGKFAVTEPRKPPRDAPPPTLKSQDRKRQRPPGS